MSIKNICEAHKLWVDTACKKGARADFSGQVLIGECFAGQKLQRAHFGGANLMDADFSGAKLQRANFTSADLRYANLTGVDFSGAVLTEVDFSGAKLTGADLTDAVLWGCQGDGRRIKKINGLKFYHVVYTSDRLQIGCRNHSFDEWRSFSEEEIGAMDESALEFWRVYKDFIFEQIEKDPAE